MLEQPAWLMDAMTVLEQEHRLMAAEQRARQQARDRAAKIREQLVRAARRR